MKSYDDLSKAVNQSYEETGDIRLTLKEIRKIDHNISFGEVWEMLGFKDDFDFSDPDDL